MSDRIEHRLSALALDDRGEIEGRTHVVLSYTKSDPWAVSVAFPEAREYTVWVVARCLISEGLNQITGDGDFRVTPEAGMVRIELSNSDGRAAVALDIDEVEEFVLEAFALVPEGSEKRHVDLDALVRELLGGVR